MDRWNFKIRDTEPDDTAMARRIAGRLVDSAPWARNYRPYVIVAATPQHDATGRLIRSRGGKWPVVPPTNIEWTRQHKNTFGVSIGKREPDARARAVEWVASTLLKGYTVFVDRAGHSLKGGDYADDIWDFEGRQKAVA